VDTGSSDSIARVDGTCVAIVTVLSIMFAGSSGRVARVNGAWIVVITVLWISVDTVLGVASRDGAKVCRSRNWNWSVDTVSGVLIASISGTCIVVVTNHRSVDTSSCCIASINSACISVVTNMVGVSASSCCIARVISTCIVVITVDWGVRALSRCLIARVSCAVVIVITVNIFGVESFVTGTEPNLAFVDACCVLCCKIDWSILASFYNIARISCAWVGVVTRDCIVMDDSSCSVTVIFGTCIVVINWFEGVDASIASIASINSARISIITNNRSRNTSFDDITRVFGTFVCIRARNWSVDTVSSVAIARIGGTCVAVVTVYSSINTFSRRNITRNSLAVFLSANNRSEDAVSV
jgi:hypothetical protein